MKRSLMVTGEGHGEVEAASALVARVLKAQGHVPSVFQSVPPARRFSIIGPGALERACEYARSQRPDALLITSDWEDGCPSSDAPELAQRVRSLGLPFPVAVVLFYREYETLALSIARSLAGQELALPGHEVLRMSAAPEQLADPESERDAKGWIRTNLFGGTSYKPTTHQLALTRAMRPDELRAANLSSFRRLERGVDHLAQAVLAGSSAVYPQ